MSTLTHAVHFLNKYRADVYLVFTSVLFINWSFYPLVIPTGTVDPRWVFGVAFVALYVWIFLFNKTCDTVEDRISQPDEVVSGHETRAVQVAAWACFVIGIGTPLLYGYTIWPLLLYAFFGAWYSYPFFGRLRLKNLFIVKTLAATLNTLTPFILAVYIYFLPYFPHNFEFNLNIFIGLAALFAVIELIWDIRDVEGDRVARVYTIPVVLGVASTKLICFGLLLIAAWTIPPMFPNQIVLITLAFMVGLVQSDSPRHWFHLLLYFLSAVLLTATFIYLL